MVYLPPLLALGVLIGLLVAHERWKQRHPRNRRFEGMRTGEPGRGEIDDEAEQTRERLRDRIGEWPD